LTVRGPIVLGIVSAEFRNVVFGITNNDLETILFQFPQRTLKLGIAAVENCVFEDCVTEHVAIAGTREDLDYVRREVGPAPNG